MKKTITLLILAVSFCFSCYGAPQANVRISITIPQIIELPRENKESKSTSNHINKVKKQQPKLLTYVEKIKKNNKKYILRTLVAR